MIKKVTSSFVTSTFISILIHLLTLVRVVRVVRRRRRSTGSTNANGGNGGNGGYKIHSIKINANLRDIAWGSVLGDIYGSGVEDHAHISHNKGKNNHNHNKI
jgi:hypothetical protein